MKNFFKKLFSIKFIFSSCLGVILASFVCFGLLMFMGGIIGALSGGKGKVEDNSVLALNFSDALPEKTNNVPTNTSPLNFDFEQKKKVGLYDMARCLEMAKDDKKIKGIFMDLSSVSMGNATASVVRDALLDFKESGKFVYAYADNYSQGSYYLASLADSIFVHPLGSVEFKGFSSSIPFLKDMLDKLGVKMQIYYVGNFKSATEPYRLNQMSDDNRKQVTEYLQGLYQVFLEDVSESRGISKEELHRIADGYLLRNADDALEYKFVDKHAYRDEMIDILKAKLGLSKKKDKIKSVGIATYSENLKSNFKAKDKIAVVFAEGSIVDGEGDVGGIGGKKYAKAIRKIRQDEKVKAIVLRVNSGGGSAFASEEIWRELELAKERGLPVIASMGDVAASGGYYISCNADTILAEPNTITGSIGVFGMIPSGEDALKKHVGVQFDTVKTAKYATGISPFMNISEGEGEIIQQGVNEIYDIFLKRVGEGRGMDPDSVNLVAQGRVWTGTKALEIGLVDVMGGLEDAIAIAADKAGLDSDKYRVAQYPAVKDPFQAMIDNLTGNNASASIKDDLLREELGEEGFRVYEMMREIRNTKGVQARMPFEIRTW
jgi:protease-4